MAPPATKKLCCLVFPVGARGKSGSPDQKARTSPRILIRRQILKSKPNPASRTPVVLDLPGFVPPDMSVLFSEKCPKPPPKLTQGETAVAGNRFTRAAGGTK